MSTLIVMRIHLSVTTLIVSIGCIINLMMWKSFNFVIQNLLYIYVYNICVTCGNKGKYCFNVMLINQIYNCWHWFFIEKTDGMVITMLMLVLAPFFNPSILNEAKNKYWMRHNIKKRVQSCTNNVIKCRCDTKYVVILLA